MAYEPGGIADKFGNRFEKRWVVHQLLQLLAGRILSVQYEPVGPDEKGVDLWITRLDGRREAQQCKGEQGTRPDWSMADLARRGILDHLRNQLQRDGLHVFALVSATPAVIFRDLSDRARNAVSSKSYWEHQIKGGSKPHSEGFLRFCKSLGFNHEVPDDREMAFDLLRRSHYHPFSDDSQTIRAHETWADCFVSGRADRVLDALWAFAETDGNYRREIYADEVYKYLRGKGHPPRDLVRDERLSLLVKGLGDRFGESLRSHLAAGQLIPRPETRAILEWVSNPGSDRLLLLHGPAGGGKSGILYELAMELEARGIPFLPFRLDLQPPMVNSRKFGEDRGLPASPAMCLHHFAGTRTAVLVIDQLDALRWTSAHSSEAFSICQEMIRETLQLGENLLVVIGCRTFDLEYDPQIKKWQQEQSLSCKIPVGPLPEAAIREVVDRVGVSFNLLTPREKQLLSNVQNLTMWTEIAASGETPRFSTVMELSKQFWKCRRAEISSRGVPTLEVEHLLDIVTTYMESHSRLNAPERLLEQHPQAADALQSLNVLQVAERKVSFCHQSYLDYQVASKLLREIDSGSASVLTWLGNKDRQSLFRREQLRLVLLQMRDEEPPRFLETLRELLSADVVRFHLKQVALQCLGQLDNPSGAECQFVTGLLRDPELRDHAFDQILWANATWFGALDDQGEWQNALGSGDESRVIFALQMMRLVSMKCGDRIARLIAPYIDAGGDWPKRCLYVIPFDPAEDTDAIFDLRLFLARHGEGREIVYLPEIARKNAGRFIRLLDVQIARKLEAENQDGPASEYDRMMDDLDRFDRKERLAFRAAGTEHELALDLLLPAARRIAVAGNGTRAFYRHGYRVLPVCLTECLIAAGSMELRQDADGFFRRIEVIPESEPGIIHATILAALTYGPDEIADRALEWLMARPACLRSGERFETSEWEPARRLIHRFSRRCSDEAFRSLETFLLQYTDEDERRSMVNRHEQVRGGWLDSPNRYGQTQYHLLPALPSNRKSRAASGQEGVLRRKFTPHRDHMSTYNTPRGGFVTSPIRQEPHRISDPAWLGIIASNAAEPGQRAMRYYADHCTESSPAQFAGDLANATRRDPARFACLALRIPADANPVYLNAILNNLSDGKPAQDLSEEEKKAWGPPSLDVLQPVVLRALERSDILYADALCRILRERHDLQWPPEVIEAVIRLALSEVPRDSSAIFRSNREESGPPSVDDLEQRSINCLRGAIAWAIQALLWSDIARLPLVQTAMEELVSDPDPAVRVAAIGVCGPVWNVDKDVAARWFAEACGHEDDRVMACRKSWNLMRFIARSHPETAILIIRRMIASSHPETSTAGAAHATILWLCKGQLEEEVSLCRTGQAELRRGIALAAADRASDDDHCRLAIEFLTPLLDDEDEEVRKNCDRIFQKKQLLEQTELKPFLEAYIRSRSFLGNQWVLMHAFGEYAGSLVPLADLLMGIIEVCAGPLLGASRDPATRSSHDLSEIGPLLIRLYEQANGDSGIEIRQRCLDAWDVLLERRVGIARTLTSAIDQ